MPQNNPKSKLETWIAKAEIPFLSGDTSAKLFFIGLSVLLWFLIRLSDGGYVGTLYMPLQFTNQPSNLHLQNTPAAQLTLEVRSEGFEIIKHKIKDLDPILLDLSKLRKRGGRHYWLPTEAIASAKTQLSEVADVLLVKPDTIWFNFKELTEKKVKVHLDYTKAYSNLKSMYAKPWLSPEYVILKGSEEALDAIDSISTVPLKLLANEDSLNVLVKLQRPVNKEVSMSHDQTRVRILFTNLTEGTVEVPVKVINVPTSLKLTLFPKSVNVTYQVPVEDFARISANDFELEVDYQTIKADSLARFVPVVLQSYPSYLRKVQLSANELEYILTQK